LEGLLSRLGGELGIASERDGPYLLLRILVCLFNYEVTKEALEEEEGSFLGIMLDVTHGPQHG